MPEAPFTNVVGRGPLRAEIVCALWECFSAVLFVSAVLPIARGEPLSPVMFAGTLAVSALLSKRLVRVGDRGLFIASALRFLAWPVSILPLAAREDPRTLIATATFGLMAAAMRRAIYRREIGPGLPASEDGAAVGVWMRRRFAESAMLAGILGGHLLLLFTVAFLRAESKVVFRGWWQLLPILAVSATAVYTLAMRSMSHSVVVALQKGPAAGEDQLVAAARVLRLLPARLSWVNLALWVACTTGGVFYFRIGPTPFVGSAAIMQLGYATLFAWGVAFYQRGWDRDIASEVEAVLLRWADAVSIPSGAATDARPARVPPPAYARLAIRERMLRDFGWPLVFAAVLMLLSSLGLYTSLEGSLGVTGDDAPTLALVAAFLMLALAVGGVIARVARELSRPIVRVAEAAELVAGGALEQAMPVVEGPSEVARLAASVERMRETLARTIAELSDERSSLESKVEARTAELRRALLELKETQAALVQGERLASIGELVAGVAHEINNPLNAVAGSAEPLEQLSRDVREMLDAYRKAAPALPADRQKALEAKWKELDLDASLEDLVGISSVIKRATDRTVRIVQNLRNFARTTGEAVPSDLEAGLEETLGLLGSRLRQSAITVARDYEGLAPVTCRAGEINQVFMNVVMNAIQALEGQGDPAAGEPAREIAISTHAVEGFAVVAITDTGPGVPEDLRRRIFDPFFTTKPVGQGTGLGLSISTDIVRKHGGTLEVEHPAKGGARLLIRLPFAPPQKTRASLPGGPTSDRVAEDCAEETETGGQVGERGMRAPEREVGGP